MHSRIVIVHFVVLDVLGCASGHLGPHVHYYYSNLLPRAAIADPEIMIQLSVLCDLDMIFLRIIDSIHCLAGPANINALDKYCYGHLKLLIITPTTILTAINNAKL